MNYFCVIKEKIAYMDPFPRWNRTSLDKRLTIMTCGSGGGRERGGVCAEHDVMPEGSREQT